MANTVTPPGNGVTALEHHPIVHLPKTAESARNRGRMGVTALALDLQVGTP
jgi:hypothetical protein